MPSSSASTALPIDADTIGIRALRERRAYRRSASTTRTPSACCAPRYEAEGIRTVCLVPLVGGDAAARPARPLPPFRAQLARGGGGAGPGVRRPGRGRHPERAPVSVRRVPGGPHALDPGPVGAPQPPDRRDAPSPRRSSPRRRPWPTSTTSAIYRVDWERRHVRADRVHARDARRRSRGRRRALLRVEIGEGFTGWVAENGEPLLINDALDDERGKTIDGTEDVPESMLVVPMLYEGRALGVIVLSQLGFNRFTERRPPDGLDLRRLRGAGHGQRHELRAARRPVERARAPRRLPAAPARRSTSASCRRSTMPTSSRRSPTAFATSSPTTTCPIYRTDHGSAGHGAGAHPRAATPTRSAAT